MGRLTGFGDAVNLFTGRSSRHNRALRDITDLAATIQDFLQRYRLQEESPGFRFLSEDLGTVKVELTTITYHLHPLIKTAKSIMGREVAPVVEELAEEYDGKVAFAKVDVDQNQQIAGKYGIMSIPTLIIFKNGKPVSNIVGFRPKAELKRNLDDALA